MKVLDLKSPDLPGVFDLMNLSFIENKFYNLVRNLALASHSQGSFHIDPTQVGTNGKQFNRYTVAQGKQAIQVDFRTFSLDELPKGFQQGEIDSPRGRTMIATLKHVCNMQDPVAPVLTGLNEILKTNFAKGSKVSYAVHNLKQDLHLFFYSESGTDRKVVVQIQL